MKHKNKAFTLIELLVVVAIISFLASIVMASLNSARVKAKDVARIQTFSEIKNALELYYDEQGFYPDSWYVIPPYTDGSYSSIDVPLTDINLSGAEHGGGDNKQAWYAGTDPTNYYMYFFPGDSTYSQNNGCGSNYSAGKYCIGTY